MTKPKRKRELTAEELACAARLKAIFLTKKSQGLIENQTRLGEKVGISQSAVGQYLNGEIPLNLEAMLKFSAALGVAVTDIDPDAATLSLSKDEQLLLNAYRSYGRAGKEALLRVAEMAPAYQPDKENTQ